MPEEILADQESGGQDLELDVNRLSWVEFLECPQLAHLQSGDDKLCLLDSPHTLAYGSKRLSFPLYSSLYKLKTGPDTALINTITPWSHTEAPCSSKRWWEGGLRTHECNGSFSYCDPMGIKKLTHI